jgi:hypothetical protein
MTTETHICYTVLRKQYGTWARIAEFDNAWDAAWRAAEGYGRHAREIMRKLETGEAFHNATTTVTVRDLEYEAYVEAEAQETHCWVCDAAANGTRPARSR